MKVALFCGGLGLRIRDSEHLPKPMVNIGYRPIIWHVMKYYAHYGHKEFILCLGYRGDVIKDYFLKYNECLSNDFMLSSGGRDLKMVTTDIHDWTITFADTGTHSNIGQRLLAARKYLDSDEVFLANYADGLSNLHLNDQLQDFSTSDAVGSFLCVKPNLSYHFISVGQDSMVTGIDAIRNTNVLVNGGFFVFRKEIFNYIKDGEELVEEPFGRLISDRKLIGYRNACFWHSMDTFKDKQVLEDMHARGDAPWEVWKRPPASSNGHSSTMPNVSIAAAAVSANQ
jgi:glucose-1-phosphate cytidylyltransferase